MVAAPGAVLERASGETRRGNKEAGVQSSPAPSRAVGSRRQQHPHSVDAATTPPMELVDKASIRALPPSKQGMDCRSKMRWYALLDGICASHGKPRAPHDEGWDRGGIEKRGYSAYSRAVPEEPTRGLPVPPCDRCPTDVACEVLCVSQCRSVTLDASASFARVHVINCQHSVG